MALPFAKIPVGASPVEQRVGVEARAEAVPALPVVLWFSVGTSAATMARRLTAPLDPFGVARNSFAVSPVVAVMASVPLVIMGLPETVSHAGTVMATLVTVPEPEGLAQLLLPDDSPCENWPPEQSVG